jgi:hypothetical protein
LLKKKKANEKGTTEGKIEATWRRRNYVPLATMQWPRNIMTHLMFLSFLGWLMDISPYVPRESGLIEEYKNTPYVPQSANVHKLYTSIFKPSYIFLNMNISLEEHKKIEEQMSFLCSGAS